MAKCISIFIFYVLVSCTNIDQKHNDYHPTELELKEARNIAINTADWFEYTTGKMSNKKMGQCGDYALKFVLDFNKFVGKNVARLVITNNPIPSGTYRVGKRVDVKSLGFDGFSSGGSGILSWDRQLYLYHPWNGAYQIFLEKAWTPKKHFGVNMLDKKQVHVWASIGSVSVDPTYYDSWPENFPSPLGKDE